MRRAEGFWRVLARYLRPPTGRPARRVVGGLCLIYGAGRLGLFSYGTITLLPAALYGVFFLVIAVALWATAYCRLTLLGRAAAVFGFATLAALAADVFLSHGSATSGWTVAYLAYILLGEVVSQRDDC